MAWAVSYRGVPSNSATLAAKEVRSLCPYTAQINETAAFCWRVLEAGASVEELTAALMKEYEVEDPTALHEDLEQLIGQLQKSNYLIEVSETEDHA